MSIILKQETANSIATPSVGKTTLFVTTTGVVATKNPDGNVTPFPTVSGSNTQVIFNDDGAFAGNANLTFNKSTSLLTVTNLTVTGALSANDISVSSIANGTSNVDIVGGGGNVNITVGGVANVLSVTGTGANITGTINASGNANLGNLGTAGLITATGNITGGNLITGALVQSATVSATGNITGGNLITGALVQSATVSATGNITGGNLISAALIQGVTVSATGNVIGGNIVTSGSSGNITGANVITATTLSATGNITGGNANIIGTTASTSRTTGALKVAGGVGVVGDVYAGNSIVVDGGSYGNVTTTAFASVWGSGAGPNPYSVMQVRASDNVSGIGMQAYTGSGTLYGNTAINFVTGATIRDRDVYSGGTVRAVLDSTGLTVTGIANISGNILTGGLVSATGNVIGNYILGNGALLTGVITSVANINSGTSNVTVVSSGGNVTVGVGGTSNVAVFASTGEYVTGLISATGNITGGNILTAGALSATGAGYFGGGLSVTGNITASGNINYTNVNDLVVGDPLIYIGANNTSNLVDLGIVGSANVDGVYQHTGIARDHSTNIWRFFANVVAEPTTVIDWANSVYAPLAAGAITSNATVSASGNIIGGNITTVGQISATGNITGGNLITGAGSGGNLTGANVISATTLSASANVIGGNITTAGLITATGNITGGNILGGANVNATTHTGTTVSVTGNIDGGNLRTAGLISATGAITGAAITGSSLTVSTGNITAGNIVNSNANGVGNIGSSTTYFNTVFAKATSAQYADLAETYASDAHYAPGTVLTFGGTHEVTLASETSDSRIAGVVSTNPAHVMNADLAAEYPVVIALTGRVPTSVVGTVRKGDMMVSAGNGAAQACATPAMGTVIGKALEDFDGSTGVIEVVVGRL